MRHLHKMTNTIYLEDYINWNVSILKVVLLKGSRQYAQDYTFSILGRVRLFYYMHTKNQSAFQERI